MRNRSFLKTTFKTNTHSDFNTAFDGFRGLAILFVILSHSCIVQSESTLSRIWYLISAAGWIGVDMFFVLSGFLITRILINSRGSENFFKNFYIRRILRIFPLYYLFLLFFFVITPKFSTLDYLFSLDPSHLSWHLLFCSNLLFSKLGFYPGHIVDVSWSLSIEEQFYLFWPFFVWKLSLKQIRWTCVSLYFLSQALILGQYFSHSNLSSTYFFTLTRWDGILFGSGLAATILDQNLSFNIKKYFQPLLGFSLFISIISFSKGIHTTSPIIQSIGFPSFAIFFSLLLAQLNSPGLLFKLFSIQPLRTLGKYSYGLYLFHKPTIIVLQKWFSPYLKSPILSHSPEFGMFLFQFISVLCSLLVAMVLFHTYENRFLKLKKYFS